MITPTPASSTVSAKPAAVVPQATRSVTTTGELTRSQRNALFDEAAKDMTPANAKVKQADPLLKWIPQIMRKHRQGFSAQQIAAMSGAPGIGLKLSVRAVKRLLAEHAKRKSPAVPTAA